MQPVIKVNLDMDQVLADFDSHCISVLGKPLSSFDHSQAGWDALGDHRFDMYSKLEPMPDADLLVGSVFKLSKAYGFTVGVLTALPKFGRVPLAEQHKREWLQKYYPELLKDFRLGPHAVDKQNHAQQGHVLIDDNVQNIPQWISRGGIGILHINAMDSLKALQTYLY